MSQVTLNNPTPDILTEDSLELQEWMAAMEATIFAVASLKRRIEAGDRAAELESYAHAEFRRALAALRDTGIDDES